VNGGEHLIGPPSLDDLIADLERTAVALRAGQVDPDAAAELVERCATLAADIASKLEQAGREVEREGPTEGQERLL